MQTPTDQNEVLASLPALERSLALVTEHLGTAAPALSEGALAVLGLPPATAALAGVAQSGVPPDAVPPDDVRAALASTLGSHAVPVALAAPVVAAHVPLLAPAIRAAPTAA
jgi:hypothetical protein